MSFYDDNIPDEIKSWHDYYQGLLSEKDEIIKQLELDLESKVSWIDALRQQLHTKEVKSGNTQGNSTGSAGSNQSHRGENRFGSRCSKCGN